MLCYSETKLPLDLNYDRKVLAKRVLLLSDSGTLSQLHSVSLHTWPYLTLESKEIWQFAHLIQPDNFHRLHKNLPVGNNDQDSVFRNAC